MFGQAIFGQNGATPQSEPVRPPVREVAQVAGMLTHVLIESTESAGGLHVFVNAVPVPTGSIESLSVTIVAPTSESDAGTLTAILSRYDSDRKQEAVALFPGTLEIVTPQRRLTLTCQEAGAFEGLWLGVGLNADGTATELAGVQALRVVIAPGLLDAQLTWGDTGTSEAIL